MGFSCNFSLKPIHWIWEYHVVPELTKGGPPWSHGPSSRQLATKGDDVTWSIQWKQERQTLHCLHAREFTHKSRSAHFGIHIQHFDFAFEFSILHWLRLSAAFSGRDPRSKRKVEKGRSFVAVGLTWWALAYHNETTEWNKSWLVVINPENSWY